MSDEVRPQDIVDVKRSMDALSTEFKKEDRVLHERISKQSDQNREDFKGFDDDVKDLNEKVGTLGGPLHSMAAQVSRNEGDIKKVESEGKVGRLALGNLLGKKASKADVTRLDSEIAKWEKRFWGIVIGLITGLLGVVVNFLRGN